MTRRLHILLLVLCATLTLSAQTTSADTPASSLMASGRWVKIRVSTGGIHRITTSSLRAMGFTDPDRVRLYGTNLELLPESGLSSIPTDMQEIPLYRQASQVLFYARGLTQWSLRSVGTTSALFTHTNNPYSSYQYYFLSDAGTGDPKEFAAYAYDVPATGVRTQTTFPEHALYESDDYSFLHSGRTFYESYDFANGASRTYTLELPGRSASSEVRLNLQFAAAGRSLSTLTVALADSTLGTLSFSAIGEYEYGSSSSRSFSLPASSSESLSLRLTHNRESGVSGHLDYIRASYLRQLSFSGAPLIFRPSANGNVQFKLANASASTVVWRITPGFDMEEVKGSYDSSTSILTVPFTSDATTSSAWRSEELIAFNPDQAFPSPTVVGKTDNQDLHALRDVQLLIVVPASGRLTSQAERLARLHTEVDSMTCAVIPVDRIYNEFSGGTPDLTAVRLFVKHLYDTASSPTKRLRNVLMFGDGVWDNRMVTSSVSRLSPDDYLLCYESDYSLSTINSYVLEEYPVLIDESTTTSLLSIKPTIGFGRIPVSTASEAKSVVDKLERYIRNEQTGAWKNTIAFLCDDGNDNIHMKDGDAVIADASALYPNYYYKRIYWDTYQRTDGATGKSYPAVEAAIDKLMIDGALIVNYTGHGAPYMLSHEKVMQVSDFASWNSARLPLWLTAACDVSPFDMYEDNIGEAGLLNPDGTAMGLITTTRTVYSTPNRAFNRAFMKHVLSDDDLGRHITLGEALARAKSDLIAAGSNSMNKTHFILLGDPAISLQRPTYRAVVDDINGTPATAEQEPELTIGATATVSGHIEDEDGNIMTDYHGTVHPSVFDNLERITCLNNPVGETNGNDVQTPAYTFYDRRSRLYIGADSVRSGRFQFQFPVPVDNNYSGQNGRISLYASDDSHTAEAHGSFTRFLLSREAATATPTDTVGPTISFYLNTSSFRNGDIVNETPLLVLQLADASGLNLTGSGVGHDITLVIDNDETRTYSLNSYFEPTISDYRSGSIAFSIPTLEDGAHSLLIRAFDVFNNASVATADFSVNEGQRPHIFSLSVDAPVTDTAVFRISHDRPSTILSTRLEVFDITGRRLWQTEQDQRTASATTVFTWKLNETDSHLQAGVYIVRATISSSGGETARESQKFIVVGPR